MTTEKQLILAEVDDWEGDGDWDKYDDYMDDGYDEEEEDDTDFWDHNEKPARLPSTDEGDE